MPYKGHYIQRTEKLLTPLYQYSHVTDAHCVPLFPSTLNKRGPTDRQ